jgi:CDP-glucose 4,6-dehydratase
LFDGIYEDKRVMVTGHTGFKGSWLCAWLLELGTEVCGYSVDVPTQPSHFEILGLEDRLTHVQGDVRDREALQKTMDTFRPNMVFHLAAQALVRRAYDDPVGTFETNTMGTLNVLECLRHTPSVKAAVIITSDKCYRNAEWPWGYRENDTLGGEDPYSSSKGCAELIIYSYLHSFFNQGPHVASARAGNVIGGGDWAEDRIVPDAMRTWSNKEPVVIRNPASTRPWQHVLEPLSGYLSLGVRLWRNDPAAVAEAFNFGPDAGINQSVSELLTAMIQHWPERGWEVERPDDQQKKESSLLKLSCDKALNLLSWRAILSFEEAVRLTVSWYRSFYEQGDDMKAMTADQIRTYAQKAKDENMWWAEK